MRRPAHGRRLAADRRQRAHSDADHPADARCGGRVPAKSTCSGRSRTWTPTICCIRSTPRATTTPRPDLEKIKAPLTADQLGRRFHQSAGTWHRRARDQAREERPLRAAAGLRSDPRPRHPHLGRVVAAIPGAIAGRLEERRRELAADGFAIRRRPARHRRGLAASISLMSALRSLASMAREWPRGRSRARCTGPKRTRIRRLTMMPRAAHQCRTCAERVARTVTLSQ